MGDSTVALPMEESAKSHSVASAPPKTRLRLSYLDGMRGIAALFVVLFHGYEMILAAPSAPLSPLLQKASVVLRYGHYAVAVFIVISGYCLMLPLTRSKDGALPGGFLGFMKRRARRILPPYYAALFFSLALIALLPVLHTPYSPMFDVTLPAFAPTSVGPHLLLIHNLQSNWCWRINRPLWSVALEWQFYFGFALLLIPLWRRFGIKSVLTVSFALTCLPYFLRPNMQHFDRTAPWLFFLFALGMAGAEASFPSRRAGAFDATRLPWGVLTLAFTALFLIASAIWPALEFPYTIRMDILIGFAIMSFLVYTTKSLTETPHVPALARFFESPAPVRLGAFSYSLYLTHDVLLWAAFITLQLRGVSQNTQYVLLWGAVVPGCLMVAYGFHLIFERPFLSAFSRVELRRPTVAVSETEGETAKVVL